MNAIHPSTVRRMGMIKAALIRREMDEHDLAAAVYLSPRRTQRYIALMREMKIIRVVAWRKHGPDGRQPIRVYGLGSRKDAPRPPLITVAQRQADYVKRRNLDPDRLDRHRAKDQARKLVIRRDPMTAAFFGAGSAA